MIVRIPLALCALVLLSACALPGALDRNFSLAENPSRAVVIVGISVDEAGYGGGATWRTYDPATDQAYPDRYGQMAEPNFNFFQSSLDGAQSQAGKVYYKIQHVKPGHYFFARIGRGLHSGFGHNIGKLTSYTGWDNNSGGIGTPGPAAASDVDLTRHRVPRFELRAGTIAYIGTYAFSDTGGDTRLNAVTFDEAAVRALLAAYPRLTGDIVTAPVPDDVAFPLRGETKILEYKVRLLGL